jgi:hypothetical protein
MSVAALPEVKSGPDRTRPGTKSLKETSIAWVQQGHYGASQDAVAAALIRSATKACNCQRFRSRIPSSSRCATVSLRYSAHDPQCPAAVGSLSRLIPCANREIGQLAGTDALEGPPAGDRHQVPRLGSWTL